MPKFICQACGTQHEESAQPPATCVICNDDRQYVRWAGQSWTTHDALMQTHRVRIERDADIVGVGITPGFGIPQRALFVPTPQGNTLWDCISLVTPDAVEQLRAMGGVQQIAISHPHFYSSMVEWSDALGGVPIYLHEADRQWVQRKSPNIEFWSGGRLTLSGSVTLHHCPGHFPGSTVLHWENGPGGRNVLLAGDSIHVAQDRRHVSFVHSVPNHLPMHPDAVLGIRERLGGLAFDDVYGFTWGLNIIGGARQAVDESFERHLRAVGR